MQTLGSNASSFNQAEGWKRTVSSELTAADSDFAVDVVAGLSARERTLPPKYFYDAAGSELFEAISRTPEYYPTRVETALLHRTQS